MAITLFLLGGARVESSGIPVTGRAVQPRRIAILALLALAQRRTMSRERLVWYLWADHAPDAARRLLSESLYVLRRDLGDAVITSSGDEVTLGEVVCDVDAFLAANDSGDAAAAVAAYRGPLLEGWYVREAPEFEQWVEVQRVDLASAHAKSVRRLAEARQDAGDWSEAATWWQALVRLDPYSSTAVLNAARALASAGEPAAALQAIATHETLLKEELGVGANADLTSLAQEIRQGNLAPQKTTPLPGEPAPPNSPLERPAIRAASTTEWTPARRPWQRKPYLWIVSLLGVAAAVLAAPAILRSTRLSSSARAVDEALDRRRIAIAYFDDRTANHDLGYLADGLTEYLIDELARQRGLRVLSADAVRRLRGATVDSVVRVLNARTIVRGDVEQIGDSIRVHARLIDGRSNEQVGLVAVQARVGNTFALRDALSAQIATELIRWVGNTVQVARARDDALRNSRSDRALELVFRAERLRKDAEDARISGGRDSVSAEAARRALRLADSLLAEAEALDRGWAVPAVGRGWVAMQAGILHSGTARVLDLSSGLAHAERAITLVESRPPRDTMMLARGLYLRGLLRVRSATAVQTFRAESTLIQQGEADLVQAVALDSTLAGAWAGLALPRWLRGDFRGVGNAAEHAIAADAYLENAADVIGWAWRAAYARADLAEAQRWCFQGRQRLPADWHFVECELTIMRLDVAGMSGRRPDPARAWALIRELERIDPAPRARAAGHPYSPISRRMIAAMVSGAAGDHRLARETLSQARAEVRGDVELSTDLLYESACLYFVLGERTEGERLLAEYLRARPDLSGFLERDAVVRRLRGRG